MSENKAQDRTDGGVQVPGACPKCHQCFEIVVPDEGGRQHEKLVAVCDFCGVKKGIKAFIGERQRQIQKREKEEAKEKRAEEKREKAQRDAERYRRERKAMDAREAVVKADREQKEKERARFEAALKLETDRLVRKRGWGGIVFLFVAGCLAFLSMQITATAVCWAGCVLAIYMRRAATAVDDLRETLCKRGED